jgi:hypothetical protein
MSYGFRVYIHFTSLTLRFQNSIALAADRHLLVVAPQYWWLMQYTFQR